MDFNNHNTLDIDQMFMEKYTFTALSLYNLELSRDVSRLILELVFREELVHRFILSRWTPNPVLHPRVVKN
jgi:hypothetical protein